MSRQATLPTARCSSTERRTRDEVYSPPFRLTAACINASPRSRAIFASRSGRRSLLRDRWRRQGCPRSGVCGRNRRFLSIDVLEKPEMRHALLLTMLSVMLLLTGCAKHAVKEAPPAATEEGAGAATPGLETNGVGQGSETGAGAAGEQAGINVRIIYFDFDNADIRPEYRDTIAAHARRLSGTTQRIRLEGHTDERGSREYNIGLGERRAQAVRKALMLLGVSDQQIATVSYGEERPAVQGDDEQAWAKNRRVEIVYIQ